MTTGRAVLFLGSGVFEGSSATPALGRFSFGELTFKAVSALLAAEAVRSLGTSLLRELLGGPSVYLICSWSLENCLSRALSLALVIDGYCCFSPSVMFSEEL